MSALIISGGSYHTHKGAVCHGKQALEPNRTFNPIKNNNRNRLVSFAVASWNLVSVNGFLLPPPVFILVGDNLNVVPSHL